MPAELHETSLIALLAIGFVLALLFGLLAGALRVSPIVGYLVAGIAVGPFTPGFVADSGLAGQLAEIGVILLMFGVGLHFSIKDLMSVRYIALPGAIAQILTATAIGAGLAHLLGWNFGTGLVFGLSLSVASTANTASGSRSSTVGSNNMPTDTKNKTAKASFKGSKSLPA